jgi:hypothetical protein
MGKLPMVKGRVACPNIVDAIGWQQLKTSGGFPITVEEGQVNRRFIQGIHGDEHLPSRYHMDPNDIISLCAPIVALAGRNRFAPRIDRFISV